MSQLDWFNQWNDYQLMDLIRIMIHSQQYESLLQFMCTCRRLARLGQPLLQHERQRLIDLPPTRQEEGCHIWLDMDGQIDRGWDLPAIIYDDGRQEWRRHGHTHRDRDRPAVINAQGVHLWYMHDQLHREGNLPACIYPSGRKEWAYHGVRYLPWWRLCLSCGMTSPKTSNCVFGGLIGVVIGYYLGEWAHSIVWSE